MAIHIIKNQTKKIGKKHKIDTLHFTKARRNGVHCLLLRNWATVSRASMDYYTKPRPSHRKKRKEELCKYINKVFHNHTSSSVATP